MNIFSLRIKLFCFLDFLMFYSTLNSCITQIVIQYLMNNVFDKDHISYVFELPLKQDNEQMIHKSIARIIHLISECTFCMFVLNYYIYLYEYLYSQHVSFILIKRRKINRVKGIKQYATYVWEIADKNFFFEDIKLCQMLQCIFLHFYVFYIAENQNLQENKF